MKRKRGRMGWLWTLIGLYLMLLVLMTACQRMLLYPASKERPDLAAAGFTEVTVEGADGLELRHGYRPPATPDGPVVVLFHGNAGHIGHRADKFRALPAAGVGLLLAEYRGYGGNPGSPTEADLTEDGSRLLAWLAGQGVGPERTLLYGESLGTGSAVKLAAAQAEGRIGDSGEARPYAGLILEAPFTSIADVAQSHYWYLPAKWLLLDKWDVTDDIGKTGTALLLIHGERDRTVPTKFGRELLDLAPEPKQGYFLAQASHNDLWSHPVVAEKVLEFIRSRVPEKAAAAD